MSRSATIRILVPLAASWIVGITALATPLSKLLLPHPYLPALPNVAVPYVHGSDVVSVVPFLFRCLTVVLLCVLIAELAKVAMFGMATMKRSDVCLVLLYQLVLAGDFLRRYASDWTTYFLSFLRIIRLDEHTYDLSRRLIPLASPWISFAMLAIVSAILWRHASREGMRGELER